MAYATHIVVAAGTVKVARVAINTSAPPSQGVCLKGHTSRYS
jgi:hypothetical protein